MDNVLELLFTALPPTISATFAAIIIIGCFFVLLMFIHRFWKTYHDSISLNRDEDMNMSMKIYDKISALTDNYSGKYLTDQDMRDLREEFRREIVDIYKEINALKKKFGIK